jgi:hypothetical protein
VTDLLFLMALAALSTGGLVLLGARAGLPLRGLAPAARETVEGLGLIALLVVANIGLSVLVTIALRPLGSLLPVYIGSDDALPMVALAQALLIQAWRRAGGGTTST